MSTLQAWIIVGAPVLALAAALFAGRSPLRAAFGYLVLVVGFAFFLLGADDPVSAAIIGTVGFLLVAAGRGQADVESAEDELYQVVPFREDDPNVDEPRHV